MGFVLYPRFVSIFVTRSREMLPLASRRPQFFQLVIINPWEIQNLLLFQLSGQSLAGLMVVFIKPASF